MTKLRVFTPGAASGVQPGHRIDWPKPMDVEEVHQTLSGMKLIGQPLEQSDSKRRTSIEMKGNDPVERPVPDEDWMVGLLREAFKALETQYDDDADDSPDGRRKELTVDWRDGGLDVSYMGKRIRFEIDRPRDVVPSKDEPAKPAPAKAPAKKAAGK